MIKRLYTRVRRLIGRDSSPDEPRQRQSEPADDADERQIDGSGNPIIDEVYNGQYTAAKELQSIRERAEELEDDR